MLAETGTTEGAPPAGAPAAEGASATERAAVLDRLWQHFTATRDDAVRRQLADLYYPLVKHVARTMRATLSRRAELDDLEGYGAEGLLDAIDRYDPARGIRFPTFAAHRIRGAVIDGLRSADWAPRSLRRRERDIAQNHAWLSSANGRAPTEEEEAAGLGISVDALRTRKHQIAAARVASMEDQRGPDRAAGVEPPDSSEEPLAVYLTNEMSEAVRAALLRLDERERVVVTLSFDGGLTLAEIGETLGVTESRACQIRARALSRLRAYFRSQGLAPG